MSFPRSVRPCAPPISDIELVKTIATWPFDGYETNQSERGIGVRLWWVVHGRLVRIYVDQSTTEQWATAEVDAPERPTWAKPNESMSETKMFAPVVVFYLPPEYSKRDGTWSTGIYSLDWPGVPADLPAQLERIVPQLYDADGLSTNQNPALTRRHPRRGRR